MRGEDVKNKLKGIYNLYFWLLGWAFRFNYGFGLGYLGRRNLEPKSTQIIWFGLCSVWFVFTSVRFVFGSVLIRFGLCLVRFNFILFVFFSSTELTFLFCSSSITKILFIKT